MYYKKILRTFCTLLFLFYTNLFVTLSANASSSDGISIIPGSNLKAYKYSFKNGLRLIVIPDNRNTLATVHFILDAGSDREELGKTGLAHFFEHMMFRKTKGLAEGNYDRVLASVGGSGNAGTGDSLVTYYSNFPAPALQTMLKLESARFLHLDLKDPYFNIEKGAVISERNLRVENNPVQRGYEVIRSEVQRGTPQEWMVIGEKQDVKNLNIKTAQKFYKDFYTPNNTLIVIGGAFEPDYVEKLVEEYFGEWKGHTPSNSPKYPNNYLTRDIGKRFICSEPITTKNIQLVYPSFDSSQKSVVYSWLFLAMLNNTKQGSFEYRLQKNNMANQFMLEKVYYNTKFNPINVHFVLSEKQNIKKVEQFWNKNVRRVLNTKLSQNIIDQVIKNQKVYNADIAEKLTSVVNLVTDNSFFYNDPAAQETEMNILKNVTEKEFKQWVQNIFAKKQYYMTGIVPTKDAKSCESNPFSNNKLTSSN